MSKQLLINDRPSDNGPSLGGYDMGGGGSDWPKASIGNYKGVMLCNRPNELGQQRKPDRTGGNIPFNSRVMPDEPIGWNPTKKVFPKSKRKIDPNNILLKHKKFLRTLEEQKIKDREDKEREEQLKQEKKKKLMEASQNQRKKITELKRDDQLLANTQENGPQAEEQQQPQRLTEENLRKNESQQQSQRDKKKTAPSQHSKKQKAKPAWAMTAKEQEDVQEAEIDELIEFAYELDYEKYMEDFEVRQALAIIKDRVQEIKKDQDWKKKMADEWNEAAAQEGEANNNQGDNGYQQAYQAQRRPDDETKSAVSFKSAKTGMSKGSLRSQVQRAIAEEGRPEWDPSVKSERKLTTEDRVAAQLAAEVLKDNLKLKGIHSKQSLQKMLMNEAKKQLMQNDGYKGPVVSVIKDKEIQNAADPSNLPYLHKNPAI